MSSEFRVDELVRQGALSVGDGYRAKNSELAPVGLPFARVPNVTPSFDFSNADCFPLDNLAKVANKRSQPGDVVFTAKGTIGKFAFVRNDTPAFVYSPQLCYWRSMAHDLIDPRWLYCWMRSAQFERQFTAVAHQTDMAGYVSLRDQLGMTIVVPPLDQQHLIASILGALDDKIELNRRMSQTLDEMAQAIFKSWFVDPSRSALPSGWAWGALGDLAQQVRALIDPRRCPDERFDHYSIPAFDDGRMPAEQLGAEIKSAKTAVVEGAILLSKLNPNTPRVWWPSLHPDCRSITSTEFLVLLPTGAATREFLFGLVQSARVSSAMQSMVTGTSGSHQRVKPENVMGVRVPIPPAQLVADYSNTVSALHTRQVGMRTEGSTLTKIRDSILPQLLSGELEPHSSAVGLGRR